MNMSMMSQAAGAQTAVTFGCSLTFRSEEHNGFLQVHGANEAPNLRVERNNAPLLHFDSSIFSLVREGFAGLVTEKEIRYNTIVCLVNNATRTTANVQLTDGSERGLRVIMHATTKSTSLRISPKYKTHSSSEFVHHGDKVAFNIDDTDLFLRIAEKEDGSFELVAASEPTVFDLKRFDRGAAQQYCSMANYVQAGRTLSIYHRVHDMFLSHSSVEADKRMHKKAIKRNTQWQVSEAAGSGGADRHLANEQAIASEAEMLLRHTDVFFSEALTTGALEVVDPGAAGLWVIEAADPTVGGPLRTGEMYRLRHFASGGYLAVRPANNSEIDWLVSVVAPDDADMAQDTLFDVEAPVENDLGHVSTVQSVVRFRHVRTQKWISTLDTTGTVISPATIHDKGHNRDRLRLRHIPEVVESELQFAVGHLRHFAGWIEYFEELQNMPRSLSSVMVSKETRAVVVRTVESLLALIDLVCRPPAKQYTSSSSSQNKDGTSNTNSGQNNNNNNNNPNNPGGKNDGRPGGPGGPGSATAAAGGGGGGGGHHHHGHQINFDKLGLPDPIRQRRLHELGVENLLLRVALAPFQARGAGYTIPCAGGVISLADVGAKECTPIITAVRLCFQLLRCIVKGSPQHCTAALTMVEPMVYLESHNLHVAPALLAILEYGGQADICESLLKLNDTTPNGMYIDAIAHYCTSDSRVREIIDLIAAHKRTLIRTAVEYGRLMFAHHTIGKQTGEDNILDVVGAEDPSEGGKGGGGGEDDHVEAVTFDVFITQEDAPVISYFVATLRLFLAMARNGGLNGLEFARGQIVREEILIVFSTSFKDTRNQNQSDIVKATYAELATVLYLNRVESSMSGGSLAPVLVDPSGVLKGTAVRAIGAGTASSEHGAGGFQLFGSQNTDGTFLRQLKMSALEFIKDHPVQVVELTGRNQMMWNCISIWHVFVAMRTASVSELKEVIPLLLNVLDGATDVQSLVTQDYGWDRYVLSEDSMNVLKTKSEICSLLETFVQQLQEEFAAIANEKLSIAKDNAETIVAAAEAQVADLINCLNIPRLIEILLDLILYESQDLMNAATSLLTAVCHWKETERSLIEDMHLLPWGSEKLMQQVLDECVHIIESDIDAEERLPYVDRFIQLFKTAITSDDTSRNATGRQPLRPVVLEALRAWGIHERVLEILPEDPSEEPTVFTTCIDFFLIFARLSKNADAVAEHWPLLLTSMQKEPTIQGHVLQLLRLIWAKGNRLTPVQHADIKFVVSLIDPVDSLEVLPTVAALLSQGIPSHQLQRDVLNILIDFDILKPNWWIRLHGQMTTNLTNVLELCAAGGNPYTNSIVTSRLPLVVVVRQLHSTGMAKISVKCTLVRFATVAHFSETVAARAVSETTEVILGELWWRLIRDDFMVRLDELPAALDVNDSLKQYIVELASLLTAFFDNRFQLSEVLRYDQIVKELRHVAATIHHVCSSLTTMKHLTPPERFVLYKLGKSVLQSLNSLKDHSVQQLRDCISQIDEKALLEAPTEILHRIRNNNNNNNSGMIASPERSTSGSVDAVKRSRSDSERMGSVSGGGGGSSGAQTPTSAAAAAAGGGGGGESFASATAAAGGSGGGGGNRRDRSVSASARSMPQYSGSGGGGGGDSSGASFGGYNRTEFLQMEERYSMCQARLDETLQVMEKRTEEDQTIEILVSFLASLDFADANCWKQRVTRRLLLAAQRQQFGADAICVILRAVRMCIESVEAPRGKVMQMQNMMESLGALPVATRLFDAVNTDIIMESLKLGIATLLDGNARAQNHFLDYLLATEEKMFFAIKRCCERSSLELFYWRRSQKNASNTVDLHSSDLVFSYLKLMLRFVQLLCEGHNLGLQEYVREQHDNIRSINTLHCVIGLMKTLLLGATQPVEEELIQCFELCTEVCQGPCANNQLALISSGCGSIINTTLIDPTISLEVKSSAVTTLLSLLEGCTDPQVAEVIERAVPISTLVHLYRLPITDESDAVVYSVGIFLRILQDLFKSKPRRASAISDILNTRPDIARKTGIIQIERANDVERVYFRIPDACLNIREESKRRLLWDVDRSSQSAKLASFVELADDLILEMDLTETHVVSSFEMILEKFPDYVSKWLPHAMNPSVEYWIFLSTSVAVVHNACFLLDVFNFIFWNLVLGICQIVLSCCIIFIDWQVASNVFIHKYKKLRKQHRVGSTHGGASSGVAPASGGGFFSSASSSSSSSTTGDSISNSESASGAASSGAKTESVSEYAAMLHKKKQQAEVGAVRELFLRVSRVRSVQGVAFLLFAILGTFYSPYALGIHLLWVIDLSPAFQNVVAAISLNAKTLGLTIVLGMLFIYFFSMVGYSMFPEDFDTDDDPLYKENCASLSNCFLFLLTTGLRSGGGVGDVMRAKSWRQPQFIARKIYDFSFFALMIIVFLNILFGIIIDTFAELRDAKSRKEDDMKHRCFICGYDSHVFDRHGEGFGWHIKHEHSMWQYLYFLHHLRVKPAENYTGQESYIALLLSRKDFSFFPQRCLSLEGKKLDEMNPADDIPSAITGGASGSETGGGGVDGSSSAAAAGGGGGGTSSGQKGALSKASDGGAMVGGHGGHNMMMPHGGIAVDATMLQNHFDKLAQQLRKAMVVNSSGGSGGSAEPTRRNPGATGRVIESQRYRSALDVACQTVGGDSVVSLQFQLSQAQQDVKKLQQEKKEMQTEMKNQVDEIWKLKASVQNQIDAQNRIHLLEYDLAAKHRECDLAFAERDAVLRQNAFLQKEADRLLVTQTQAEVAQRMKGPERVTHQSPLHSLRDSIMQRSQLYDMLQIPASPATSTSAAAGNGNGGNNNNNNNSNNNSSVLLRSPIITTASPSSVGGSTNNNNNNNNSHLGLPPAASSASSASSAAAAAAGGGGGGGGSYHSEFENSFNLMPPPSSGRSRASTVPPEPAVNVTATTNSNTNPSYEAGKENNYTS